MSTRMTAVIQVSRRTVAALLWAYTALVLVACTDDTTEPQLVASVVITPADVILYGNGSAQLEAATLAVDGSPLSRNVAWSSQDTSVASVSVQGRVQARAAGTVKITATSEGRTGEAVVRVLVVVPTGEYDLLFGNRAGHLLIQTGQGPAQRITLPAGLFAYHPAASPDGSRIAFTAYTDPDRNADIYTIDRNGGNLKRITQHDGIDDMPYWSPDGTRITFRSDRDNYFDVFTMKADGSEVIQLTFDPLPGVVAERYPAYSSDGRSIAFTSNESGFTQVWIMDLATRNTRRLTTGSGREDRLSWSPNGQFIAVNRADATGVGIAVVNVATGDLRRLPTPTGQCAVTTAPAWSPDGGNIAFTYESCLVYAELYTIKPDGTTLNKRAGDEENAGIVDPTWIRRQ